MTPATMPAFATAKHPTEPLANAPTWSQPPKAQDTTPAHRFPHSETLAALHQRNPEPIKTTPSLENAKIRSWRATFGRLGEKALLATASPLWPIRASYSSLQGSLNITTIKRKASNPQPSSVGSTLTPEIQNCVQR